MANYINNEDFLVAMIEYKEEIKKAEEKEKETHPVPDYIGECFLLIAERLSFRPNFINYAFKEDMISDGIENCLQYVKILIQKNRNSKTQNSRTRNCKNKN